LQPALTAPITRPRKSELLHELIAMDEKLRPLTLGEILDRTTRIYRHNFFTFVGVAAVPVVAAFAVFVPFGIALGVTRVLKPGHTAPNAEIAGIVLLAMLVGLPLLLVASVVSQASLTHTAIAAQNARKLKVRDAIKSVWPRFWRYLGLILLLALFVVIAPFAVAGGILIPLIVLGAVGGTGAGIFSGIFSFLLFLALFVYIVWRWIAYSMSMSTCIVEEKTAWQSMMRANNLSKGTRGRIFVMYLLVMAITIVISIVADVVMFAGIAILTALGGSRVSPFATGAGLVLGLLARMTLQVMIQPVPVIALVLFYFDQRVRTEGYDIELMMEQAGLTSPAMEAAPPLTPAVETAPPTGTAPFTAPESMPIPESPLKPSFEPGLGPDTVKEQ
jgi:hypothetical protein